MLVYSWRPIKRLNDGKTHQTQFVTPSANRGRAPIAGFVMTFHPFRKGPLRNHGTYLSLMLIFSFVYIHLHYLFIHVLVWVKLDFR